MVISAGIDAPDFRLLDETGAEKTLSEYLGKPVVLYFYPKDDTPGCTTEACNFRDDYSAYEQAGVVILGVSPDSPKKHTKFKQKYDLPFTLLADEDHAVCEKYGVWGRKKFMGREYDGVFRTTFLVDPDGKIVRVFENVKPADHSTEVLEALESIGQRHNRQNWEVYLSKYSHGGLLGLLSDNGLAPLFNSSMPALNKSLDGDQKFLAIAYLPFKLDQMWKFNPFGYFKRSFDYKSVFL